MPKPSFLDDLTADIGAPIKGSGVVCPPLFRALAAKQFLQSEMRNRTPDDDLPVMRFDIEKRGPGSGRVSESTVT